MTAKEDVCSLRREREDERGKDADGLPNYWRKKDGRKEQWHRWREGGREGGKLGASGD